jgi:hypothetical protein
LLCKEIEIAISSINGEDLDSNIRHTKIPKWQLPFFPLIFVFSLPKSLVLLSFLCSTKSAKIRENVPGEKLEA